MKYGFFDNDRREYVITDPRTPTKWVNYVGCLAFGGIVDHTGGALLCAGDPGLNRITKYIPQMPASEFKGTTLYLRVRDGDEVSVISPFFTPCLDPCDSYECRVGLSYQKITTEIAGIRTEVTIFIPAGEAVELRDIRVTNLRGRPVEIEIVPVVEYSHFDALKQLTNADWVPQTMMSEKLSLKYGRMALLQYPFLRKDDAVNFLSASRPVNSFESDRKAFLGDNEYGTWACPGALAEGGRLSNCEARRGDNIGALAIGMGSVASGDEVRTVTMLGQDRRERIPFVVEKYSDPAEVDAAFGRLADFWQENLSVFQCETPDAEFDAMVNIHNPRQCYMTMNWSRYLSLYQLGIGTRGIGFRDSSQDVMGGMAGAPSEAKELLRKLLSIQKPDGSAMHQFYPATMHADCGDAEEEKEKGKLVYGDDHLWIVSAVCAFLKETGDYGFLDEEISFYEGAIPIDEREGGSVFDHLQRALEWTKRNVGRHGIPLLGYADWNDTVNLPGDAESLFNACLYGVGLRELTDLCRFLGKRDLVARYESDHAEMGARVNGVGWDGEWYVRYFMESGEVLGSSDNAHGAIYTNAQSWAVLAGFAPDERALSALDAVNERLNTRFGIKLSGPGYNAYDPEIGGVTTYPPGAKENGGIFLHSNPWVMIAETMLGRGDRAFEYYSQINPAKRNDDIDLFEVEPYCYPQNILGDEHPQFGLGRNSWLSGTASWTYQAATRFILGVRPAHDGLVIDPCIPSAWDGFSVTRKVRGATYHIRVSNPGRVNSGVVGLAIDGKQLDGTCVPYFTSGEHEIEVTLGEFGAVREPGSTHSSEMAVR
ncbi:cellobiose phosphorylase [Haloferula helveola]|uniref:Cellobiose phosphorylase n=1 Tax=Haloferula helveola TaxID=490095 RepID=A0ABM7RJ25_9BACT|nr:cellobiose phosphorylase [Haloferula helveola]